MMAHTESAPTESSAELDRLSFTKLYTSSASSFMTNFWNILSTFYYLNPFHRCRESAWASFSSSQEHFMGHCYQVKQWLSTHQSAWAALSGSLSISLFEFLCVLISFSWTIRANLKDAWSVDPVFPADLCEPWVKGSTRAPLIRQL